jgi:hypothetical protein
VIVTTVGGPIPKTDGPSSLGRHLLNATCAPGMPPRTDASGPSSGAEAAGPFPQVMLANGAGAIRCIGENFYVAAATGAAWLTLPAVLIPGRSEFTPAAGFELRVRFLQRALQLRSNAFVGLRWRF